MQEIGQELRRTLNTRQDLDTDSSGLLSNEAAVRRNGPSGSLALRPLGGPTASLL